MYHLEEKNANKFLPKGASWKCLGPRENVSPGPVVALDEPVYLSVIARRAVSRELQRNGVCVSVYSI